MAVAAGPNRLMEQRGWLSEREAAEVVKHIPVEDSGKVSLTAAALIEFQTQ